MSLQEYLNHVIIFDFIYLFFYLLPADNCFDLFVCSYIREMKIQMDKEDRHISDVTTISKSQSLTSVSIKDCTLRVPKKTTTLFLYEQ